MKNKFIFLLLGLLLINSVSALDCWATFEPNTNIQLLQICPTCSYVNITSITYPNGTVFLNEEMQQQGVNFNYTLPDSSQRGKITYGTIGDKNGASTPMEESLCIMIGADIETSESLIYFILAFGVLLLFILSFYFMIITPYGNDINEKGAVIKITKLKYVKLGLILFTWVLFTWFLNILIGLSNNFVSLTMYYGFFGFMFDVMNRLALPLGIVIIVIAFFEIIRDANIYENIKKFGSALR
jgi:hypothetical protein